MYDRDHKLPIDEVRAITQTLLDDTRPAYSLREEVLALKSIFDTASGLTIDPDVDIACGETVTPSGVAISPRMASMCLDDFARTVQFIRGLHEAIADLRPAAIDRPVRILYAGCGPWATLATPLMSVLAPDCASFTLLDIHDESIESAKTLISALGLDHSVAEFVIQDALQYRTDPNHGPDIIVVEMLRAALADEPQVAVAAHLQRQYPDALMIPETVRIDLALVDRRKEFENDRDRISLGTALILERGVVTTHSIEVPEYDSECYTPMLLTTIQVKGAHVLRDYDSGVTCPRVLKLERGAGQVEFHYETGKSPGLSVSKVVKE